MKDFMGHVRFTDYQSYIDTLTVDKELVAEPHVFFALME